QRGYRERRGGEPDNPAANRWYCVHSSPFDESSRHRRENDDWNCATTAGATPTPAYENGRLRDKRASRPKAHTHGVESGIQRRGCLMREENRMDNVIVRTWEEIVGRAAGPLHLRLILQPLMACFLASRAGMRDARESRTPFFWTVARDPAQRRALLMEGWKDIAKLFAVAVVLDLIYCFIVLHRIAPLQTLLVAVTLAFVPYLLIRGIANRLAARLRWGKQGGSAE